LMSYVEYYWSYVECYWLGFRVSYVEYYWVLVRCLALVWKRRILYGPLHDIVCSVVAGCPVMALRWRALMGRPILDMGCFLFCAVEQSSRTEL
jgi:hypothetical protein